MIRQCCNDITQGAQGLVNLLALLQPFACKWQPTPLLMSHIAMLLEHQGIASLWPDYNLF